MSVLLLSWPRMIATTFNLTTVQENALLVQGALIEIYGFIVLVVYIFTGSCGILIPVLYFQFLRFKYVFSDTCKAAFAQGTLIKTHMCVHIKPIVMHCNERS